MAAASPMKFSEFVTRFGTQQACREYLAQQRFPKGFVCPVCGCHSFYFVGTRYQYQCKQCRRQTSVTAGTVMHKTHLPLTIWFWAMYLCATDKRGISAKQLATQLELSYKSAWYLLKRIRIAMKKRDESYVLSNLIEMDDAFIGGPKHGGKRGRGTSNTKIIVALSKTTAGAPKFLRIQRIADMTATTVQHFVNQHIAQGTTAETDAYSTYGALSGLVCQQTIYTPNTVALKWLHTAISNLKSFLLGTYHGRCTNVQSYFDEFCFRFNRRAFHHQLFPRLARAVATSCVLLG